MLKLLLFALVAFAVCSCGSATIEGGPDNAKSPSASSPLSASEWHGNDPKGSLVLVVDASGGFTFTMNQSAAEGRPAATVQFKGKTELYGGQAGRPAAIELNIDSMDVLDGPPEAKAGAPSVAGKTMKLELEWKTDAEFTIKGKSFLDHGKVIEGSVEPMDIKMLKKV